jgi:hypothetical protein
MDDEKVSELKTKVEARLLQKISDLEAVRVDLEEDIRTSEGDEQEKSRNLLAATINLLDQLKQAQTNIQSLIEKNNHDA